jgi:hypothetical protein
MPIDVTCSCGKQYRVPDTAAGRKVRCKECGGTIDVPAGDDEFGGLLDADLDAGGDAPDSTAPLPGRREGRKKSAGKKSPGAGGTTKVVLIICGIAGALLLVCCGGVVGIGMKFANALSFEPDVVEQTQREITAIDLPASFTPLGALNFGGFMSIPMMKMAFYQDPDASGVILLAKLDMPYAENARLTDAQMEKMMQDASKIEGGPPRRIRITGSEERTFPVHGHDVAFVFAQGVEDATQTRFRQVAALFPTSDSKGGILIYQIKEAAWDEAGVLRMIESIK